ARKVLAIALVGDMQVLVPMAGLIDKDAELARLDKEIARLDGEVKRVSGMHQASRLAAEGSFHVVELIVWALTACQFVKGCFVCDIV
ncbi:hypothetical protein OMR07_27625, partial [Methylobacterium organophilum]|nr:hypothetical protein [Methylobacterium organophilum]